MKPLKLVLIALALSSCATNPPNLVWTNKSKTQNDFYKDKTDCQTKEGQARLKQSSYQRFNNKPDVFMEECLKGQGWIQMEEIEQIETSNAVPQKSSP